MRLYDDDILSIHDIIPTTTSYLAKFYKQLIHFLMGQTEFTVLISRIGYTRGIEEICTEIGLPLVDDTRFLTVPIRVYDRLKTAHGEDLSKYGFYLIAVRDNVQNIVTPPPIPSIEFDDGDSYMTLEEVNDTTTNTHVSIIDQFIKFLAKKPKMSNVYSLEGSYTVEMNKVVITFREIDNQIHILDTTSQEVVSSIYYMELYASLEDFIHDGCDIIIDSVTNSIVYNICKVREYPRIKTMQKTYRNSFGTYKMQKLR